MKDETYFPEMNTIRQVAKRLKKEVCTTPLQYHRGMSEALQCNVWLKREDLQSVRSYKIRGAYNKIASLSDEEILRGVVCASAGNHAQGVALACAKRKIKGTVFMPLTTPGQKLEQVRMFGKEYVDIVLYGDTFDEAKEAAITFCNTENTVFIHPFDDPAVIDGQATVALEILEQTNRPIDYVFVPVGGGGLAAGVSAVFKMMSPETKIIGVEPEGAASMSKAITTGKPVRLNEISRFVDGAAVQQVGHHTFAICRSNLHDVITVAEGQVCEEILSLYNRDAIVAEPAGALSIAGLKSYAQKELIGKNVVCIISGSNNDITRMEEIKEKALLYSGLKHYFLVKFPQRPGALRHFVMEVLGPYDDITYFEYTKKNSKEKGMAIVGIVLAQAKDQEPLAERMKKHGFFVSYLNNEPLLMNLLV